MMMMMIMIVAMISVTDGYYSYDDDANDCDDNYDDR